MWTRRDHLDLKNGIILAFLAIIVVLYSKLLHQNLTVVSNFSPPQRLYDHRDPPFDSTPPEALIDIKSPSDIYETESTHFDGLVKYIRTDPNAEPNLLILMLTKDATSWGHDVDKSPRTFHDFLDLLISTNINLKTTSLALWTSSEKEYHLFRSATSRLDLARTSIFLDPNTDSSNRNSRHDPEHAVQTARRARVARFRNKLMFHALGSEPHLLWLDADVQYLSPGIIQQMLSHSSTNPDAGIITARCQDGPTYNYDKNAWAGGRSSGPGTESSDPVVAAEEAGVKQHHVDELIQGTKNSDLIPLDAVGGTILYMRAGLVWEGLNFPSYYVVGTRWGRDRKSVV